MVCRLPLAHPEHMASAATARTVRPPLHTHLTSPLRILSSSRGRWALLFAFLPPGAMALSMPLQIAFGLDIGYTEDDLADLNLWTSIASIPATLLGGWLADRWGALSTFAWSTLALTLPSAALAILLATVGWHGTQLPNESARHALFLFFWCACLITTLAGSVMVASRSAVCIQLAAVEKHNMATQFTALMALSNLANSFASAWQGYSMEKFGYAPTLAADALFGLVVLAVILHPAIRRTADAPRRRSPSM